MTNANLRYIICLLFAWCHRSTAEPGRLLLQDAEEASGLTGRDVAEGSDSLRPALEAISRRQRDLVGRPFDTYSGLGRYRYDTAKRNGGSSDLRPLEFLSMAEEGEGQPEDIGYGYQRGGGRVGVAMQGGGMGRGREQTAAGARALERLLMEYLEGTRQEHEEEQEEQEEGGEDEGAEDERRSAFRERGARSGGAAGRFVGPPLATTAFRERQRADAEHEEGDEEEENKKKRFLSAVKRLEEETEQEAEEGEEEAEGGERRRRRGGRNTADSRFVAEDEDAGYDDDVNKLDAYLELLEDLWEKYKNDNTGKSEGGNCDKDNEERREMKKRLRGGSRSRNHGDGGPRFDYFNSPIGWMGGGSYDAFGRRRRGGELAADDEQRLRNLYYALKSSGYGQKLQTVDEEEESEAYRKREPEAWSAAREKARRWAAGEGEELEYGPRQRRFPVAKRAFKRSYVAPTAASEEGTKRKKKEIKTDPKVAEALSHIFGDGAKANETNAKENGTKEEKKKDGEKEGFKGEEEKRGKVESEGEKELVEERKAKDEDKKEVKKSVDWSEYFGMDRRKKKSEGEGEEDKKKRRTAEEDKLDDWLLDQYYKTLAMSTNAAKRKREEIQEKRRASRAEEESVGGEGAEDAMDGKLRKVEDAIVEEAIKDTGAHEGTPGGRKEAEEVRGRVLSRLAAAYSLEKMRKALGEFKASLQEEEGKETEESGEKPSEGQADKLPHRQEPEGDTEEERGGEEVERKRKNKRDEEGVFLGPPIAEPLSEGYMGGRVHGVDVRENDIVSGGECPALDRLTTNCEGIGDLAGDYQHLFLDLCNWHEVCSICGSASSSSNRGAVTSCDITFLREVESLCHGHEGCRQSGRRMAVALRALRGRGASQHHHQAKSASLCWQHPCLADFLARKRRR